MLRLFVLGICFLAVSTFANDDKSSVTASNPVKSASQVDNVVKEPKFLVVESKKTKNYSIYTLEGVYITQGELDLNSRVDVTNLTTGNYLLVLGKKALQFTIQ